MMWIALAAAVSGPSEFSASMNRYLACLSVGLPADLSSRDRQTRARIYRQAASHCQGERQTAIEAAIRERQPGVSEEKAGALAIDIIDTLDPMSSCRLPGARC
jgi:hypothetical protein